METTFSIGELASRTGVRASAIRYYERRGLMPEPERVAGRRRYGEGAVRRLRTIAAAKAAGLSLADARDLLAASDAGRPAHEWLRALAERRLPEAERQVLAARARRDWLLAARRCRCRTLDQCALFPA
jgi:MerR family transcriptional regulator, redox-sensitive transcriptional activator SoxR